MNANHFGYETKDLAMIKYAVGLLGEKNIDPVKIIKDEDGCVSIFIKDIDFTPELCEEVWFKMQNKFCIDFPSVLIDSDIFYWDSYKTQDISAEFIEPIVDEKFRVKDYQEELEKMSFSLLDKYTQTHKHKNKQGYQDIMPTLQSLVSMPFFDSQDGNGFLDKVSFVDKVA